MPNGWNAMTVREMETIAKILIDEAKSVTLLRPFNYLRAKVRMFFALTELELIEAENPEVPVEEQYYVVRRSRAVPYGWRNLLRRKEVSEPFNLYLYQIEYWMKERMKWLDAPSTRTRFPYPFLRRRWRKFKGPSAEMQNFSWRHYRIAGDYMSYYLVEQNNLVAMKQRNASDKEIRKQEKRVDIARAMFLATIFTRRVKYVSTETKVLEKDFRYVSNQSIDNAKYFRHFPDVQFQVILFWWTGQMNALQRKFPRCFKADKPRKQAAKNPLELYTRTTATMEKYLGIDEEQLNNELFTVVLQHLEDMSKENEELERIRKK